MAIAVASDHSLGFISISFFHSVSRKAKSDRAHAIGDKEGNIYASSGGQTRTQDDRRKKMTLEEEKKEEKRKGSWWFLAERFAVDR
ncbi:hypothetical protein [Oryza sativa Japonica Group]|uniref:Uncharacterized protein n=1 Tax=Oryza sativa subsp. japonica TaxID=39947 RepID=Q5JK14_ORYSJ|nr:hypothetical protein [Oryza sativa Japonica Group]BAD88186.1 hypothetical protein [Oryza sativa Japonica Group]